MRNSRQLQLNQLDRKLASLHQVQLMGSPVRGWIYTIRKTLNMSLAQLGAKLKLSKQRVNMIEEGEVNGSLSLASLKATAEAMDMVLVYALVPKDGSLDKLVERKSLELAQKIIGHTHQNMQLEGQSIEEEQIKQAVIELAKSLKQTLNKAIWD